MNFLLLRGQVPQDRPKKEIMFKSLHECDDIYTHLSEQLGNKTEIWYWGGKRSFKWTNNCIEKWYPNFKKVNSDFKPDIIWARGGFKEYVPVLKKHTKALKIYYGAGQRYIPQDKIKYDIVLADSEHQKRKLLKKGYNAKLWIKPCADNIIYPHKVKKEYDVCYIANGAQAKIKGIKWVYKTLPRNFKMLHLGFKSKYKPPKNITTKRLLRKDIAKEISKCRVGVVPYDKIDSAPRAMIEMLACGLPVIVLDTVRFNKWEIEDNIVNTTNKANMWKTVKEVMYSNINIKTARNSYLKNASLEKATEHLKRLINEQRTGI